MPCSRTQHGLTRVGLEPQNQFLVIANYTFHVLLCLFDLFLYVHGLDCGSHDKIRKKKKMNKLTLFVCFICFEALRPGQQFFNHFGTAKIHFSSQNVETQYV